METHKISFRKVTKADKALIKKWWKKEHVREFWDNSPEMWKNALNYFKGKKKMYDYWLAFYYDVPYALILSSDAAELSPGVYCLTQERDHTITLDFLIGAEEYLGKGLACDTLKQFMKFYPYEVTLFTIDPAADNPKAIHVYEKAGFKEATVFEPQAGYFKGQKFLLMEYEVASC